MRLLAILVLILNNIYKINMPRQQLAQHARNQPNTSSLEDGQTSAVEHRARTKWTVEMNFALIEARNEAEEFPSHHNARGKVMEGKLVSWN